MAGSRRGSTSHRPRSRTSKKGRGARREDDTLAVPPPSDPAHVDLVAQIADLAPAQYRREREEVFRALRDDLRLAAAGRDGATPDDDYEGILFSITIARPLKRADPPIAGGAEGGARRKVHAAAAALVHPRNYWRERHKLEARHEAYVAELLHHPLVRSLPLDDVIFFAPDEVICPHGRLRQRCQAIRGLLDLGRRRPFSSKGASRDHLVRELRRYRVRPDADAEAFCLPVKRERWEEVPPVPPRPGRRRDQLQRDLLEYVGGALVAAGLPRKRAVAYVAQILRTCFGRRVAPNSLERQWRRHKLSSAR
jgi:hypothetical protein